MYSLAALAALLLLWWVAWNPAGELSLRVPGMDQRSGSGSPGDSVIIGSLFEQFDNSYHPLTESWPRFRGPFSDNISRSVIPLKEKFGQSGPAILWKVDLGEGHSGAALHHGLVYLLDYMEDRHADFLRCFSLESGKELWRRGYKVHVKRNHGMSRTVPAVTDSFVVTIGPRCHVMCVERATGKFRWGIDVEKAYQSEVPLWYTGQCPLIDGNELILATGGKALLVGVDLATGRVNWSTPNPGNWKMSHSSVMPYTFEGEKMYVYCATGGIAGISAGERKGELLWQTTVWNKSVIAPSPVCMPDGSIFVTAGYGAGSLLLKLKREGGSFSVSIADQYKPSEGLACEQQTPLYWNGHLFGILPKDGGSLRNQMVCVHPRDPRKVIWSSGPDKRFGLGPYFMADGKVYLLHEEGTLYILKPSVTGYAELDHAAVIPGGHDAWAPLAVADGFLVLRDSKTMVCIDLRR